MTSRREDGMVRSMKAQGRGTSRVLAGGATLAVVVGSLLGVGSRVLAASCLGTPSLTPPTGQTAVKTADVVTFSAPATPDTSGIVVRFRSFIGSEQFKERVVQPASPEGWQPGGGSISGSTTVRLSELVEMPKVADSIRIDIFATCEGSPEAVFSNTLPVDLVRPFIKGAALSERDLVTVSFSEEVSTPSGDLNLDWRVDGLPPLGVSGSGAERHLAVPEQDEDATPQVDYLPVGFPRQEYRDKAGNTVDAGGRLGTMAADYVRPRVPIIDMIEGQAAGQPVKGNDRDPEVKITNISTGHVAVVHVEQDGSPGLTSGDGEIGRAQADALGATVIAGDLCPQDAAAPCPNQTYTFYATAIDANKNISDGADDAGYVLDTIVPGPEAAFASPDRLKVTVRFTEAVSGLDHESQWQVSQGGPVTGVAGAGMERVLTLATAVPDSPQPDVTWTPPAADPYHDDAGNAVVGFTLPIGTELPPLIAVTDPAAAVWVQPTQYALHGTAQDAASVDVFRDDLPQNGQPDGPALSQAAVSEGSFSAPVDLNADAANNFLVQGVKASGARGSFVAVPTIVQDSQVPSVTLQAPAGGELFGGKQDVNIAWSAFDSNLEPGPITISYSPDGGTSWQTVATGESNDGLYTWTTPDSSTEHGLIRVSATDRAGRVGEDRSGSFVVDADAPFFLAETVNPTHVRVEFSEGVSGLLLSTDWRIDGQPAAGVSPSGISNGTNRATLETAAPFDPWTMPEIIYSPVVAATQLVDRAENRIQPASALAADGIAPAAPTVEQPSSRVLTGGETVQISGTTEPQTTVEIYRDDDMDGKPEGAPVGSGREGSRSYSVSVPLLPDSENHLLAVAVDSGPNTSPPTPTAPVDQDSSPPQVRFLAPEAGDAFMTGQSITVGWVAVDDHLKNDAIRIEVSSDGGKTFQPYAAGEANDGLSELVVPEQEGTIRIRVVATDLVGLQGSATSGPLSILACDLLGTSAQETLIGTNGPDTICGLGGNDDIRGLGGDDSILAGDGDDRANGGSGNDRVWGGAGRDTLLGMTGADLLVGGSDRDRLRGGAGADRLLGHSGRDRLDGGKGRDFCNGGSGRDSRPHCERGPKT